MSSGIARGFLARLGEEGKALCAEAMASSVTRRIDAPFNPYTTFDLCTECLSGLALGTALGYAGPPAFFHDPFKGRIVLGRWGPLVVGGQVVVWGLAATSNCAAVLAWPGLRSSRAKR
jgi:hypothetical protein